MAYYESYNESFRTIACKLETTPGTKETLDSNDMKFKATEVSYDNDLQATLLKIARGEYSYDPSVAGKRKFMCTFRVPVYAVDATTAPNWGELLQGCSFKHTDLGTGNKWESHSEYGNKTLTIEIYEKQEGPTPDFIVIRGRGCAGNVKPVFANVGEPAYFEFEFEGVLDDIADVAYASRLEPSGISNQQPDAFLSVGVTMFGDGVCLNTINFDMQNEIQLRECPSSDAGYLTAHIVGAHPTVTVDPDLQALSVSDNFTRFKNETTGAFVAQIGDHITMNMPKAQVIECHKPGERNGHVVNNIKLEGKYDSSGEQPFYILQGTTS